MKLEEKSLHIWCMKCKKIITAKTAKCGIKGKASACKHENRHRFQSRIWNKEKKKVDKVRTWPKDLPFDKIVQMHRAYKEDCQRDQVQPVARISKPTKLETCMFMFLDYMNDINVPEHAKKDISEKFLKANKLVLKRFLDLIGNVNIHTITEHEVGRMHKDMLDRELKPATYNQHIGIMKSFFDFLISKEYKIKNHFKDISKKPHAKKVEIITIEELEKLFEVMTYENGWFQWNKRRMNVCYPWLKDTIMLALLTGERGDGVYYLQWKHVQDNFIVCPNFKLLRGKHKITENHYAPITIDLAELLLSLGYKTPEDYLIAPDRSNRETLKSMTSRAFTHFWKQTGSKKEVTFRNLRKTYITRIRMLLGDKAKALNIHRSDEVQMNYYISQQQIQEELINIRLF